MNPLIFILFCASVLITACTDKSDRIDYTLSWTGDGINVMMDVRSRIDTILFTYATENGGFTDQMSWFQDLTPLKGEVTANPATRKIAVVPDGDRARLSYTVRCALPKDYYSPKSCLWDMFRPDLDGEMMFTRTENLFLAPEDMATPVSVKWAKIPEYPVYCIYNPGKGTDPYDGTAGSVVESAIVGDPLLEVDSVMINGRANYLVTALRKSHDMNKIALKDYFRNFYGSISEFWGEEDPQPYSMVIFPFRNNTFEMTGNGFSNGFLSRYDATADTILTTGRRDIFTHEIGHKWIGGGNAWFSEGFNEMQTGYQTVASGLDEPSYFAEYLNHALAGLHRNPHRNDPGDLAEERFWDDGDYTWLLYWRGFSYAFHLTGLVEKATGKPDAWKVMMDAVKPFLHDFSQERFLEAMGGLIGKERAEADFRKYILEGQDFDYRPEDLPSGCAIVRLPDGTPKLEITDTLLFARHFSVHLKS